MKQGFNRYIILFFIVFLFIVLQIAKYYFITFFRILEECHDMSENLISFNEVPNKIKVGIFQAEDNNSKASQTANNRGQ